MSTKVALLLTLTCAFSLSPSMAAPPKSQPPPSKEQSVAPMTKDSMTREWFNWGERAGARDATRGTNGFPIWQDRENGILLALPGYPLDYPSSKVFDALMLELKHATPDWWRVYNQSALAGYALGHLSHRPNSGPDQVMENLKALSFVVLRYAAAHADHLPTITAPDQIEKILGPYTTDYTRFRDPIRDEPYRWNPDLNGKKIEDIRNPKTTVVFYEATPARDGTRGALLLNYSVKRLTPAEWKTMALRTAK